MKGSGTGVRLGGIMGYLYIVAWILVLEIDINGLCGVEVSHV